MRRLAILLPLLLLACEPLAGPTTMQAPRVVVCATVFPLADVVREIGGDFVRVDWILDLGDPIGGYPLTAANRDRMTGVDLLVVGGQRSESWAQPAIFALEETQRVVALDGLRISQTAPTTGVLWMDPVIVREAVPAIADQLVARMPRQSEFFRQQAMQYTQRIDTILKAHPNSVFGRGRMMVLDRTFDPLLDRFGIRTSLLECVPLRLTDADFRNIRAKARDENIRALLLPFDTPGGAVADIEARTGLRVFRLDALGLTKYEQHGTYLEILEYNLTQLEEATQL